MSRRHTDWLVQAQRDLKAARDSIQTRYPNGFATGHPGEFYDQETAERTLAYGTEILEFVKRHMA